MSTVSTINRVANQNFFIALAILLVAVLTFAVVPAITSPKSAIIPAAGNQNAYVDFLRGEKIMFTSEAGINTVMADYRAGEKTLYTNVVNPSSALVAYHAGEKDIVNSVDSALVEYRRVEKIIK